VIFGGLGRRGSQKWKKGGERKGKEEVVENPVKINRLDQPTQKNCNSKTE